MDEAKKSIRAAIAEFLFLSLFVLSVPLFLAIDILVIEHGVQETSLTELSQGVLLFVCALRFGIGAWSCPQSRGFLVLVTGFFSCLFIREMDAFLDKMAFHGFWVWPAALLALAAIACSMRSRDTIVKPMADFVGTKSYFSILFGLVLLLVFSRVFGSGSLLWKPVMGEAYQPLFKTTLQEGLELLSYLFIAYGTMLYPPLKEPVQSKRA